MHHIEKLVPLLASVRGGAIDCVVARQSRFSVCLLVLDDRRGNEGNGGNTFFYCSLCTYILPLHMHKIVFPLFPFEQNLLLTWDNQGDEKGNEP